MANLQQRPGHAVGAAPDQAVNAAVAAPRSPLAQRHAVDAPEMARPAPEQPINRPGDRAGRRDSSSGVVPAPQLPLASREARPRPSSGVADPHATQRVPVESSTRLRRNGNGGRHRPGRQGSEEAPATAMQPTVEESRETAQRQREARVRQAGMDSVVSEECEEGPAFRHWNTSVCEAMQKVEEHLGDASKRFAAFKQLSKAQMLLVRRKASSLQEQLEAKDLQVKQKEQELAALVSDRNAIRDARHEVAAKVRGRRFFLLTLVLRAVFGPRGVFALAR